MAGQELPRLTRFPDWPERLAAFVEDRRAATFEWGRNDCCTFISDVALLLTGSDPMAQLRGSYADEAGAEAVLCGQALDDYVGARLEEWGATEIPALMAGRGDIVTARPGNHLMCGVCIGPQLVLPGEARLVFVPARLALRCWRY
ncbi:DUF6950 family protein [Pseudoroseomonas cervicalis]|uniref:DUF6950 family protein n=1 Tax=Teichococcus cervicalis TaxID=204525 RepID=UPI002785F30B|nr:hypothetical protein [Pseudoroseomonas cervicalis]MDQ1079690.1 hypothetical protein [Pseudoroseomonas cervicalis]